MEWLVIVALGIIVYNLWDRLGSLERRIAELKFAEVSTDRAASAVPQTAEDSETTQTALSAHPIADIPQIVPAWEPVQIQQSAEPNIPELESAPDNRWLSLPQFDFEDMFGRRLPIWAGGIALVLAGIFLVRFSIEAGLVTPVVRVVLSFVFGLLLVAGAEAAYRFEHRVADPRVHQALAGAGLATLYAGFYLAGSHYGLIGGWASFVGLAGVTAAAIALSYRFGLPCAVLALVGGFAAPALVTADETNVPLLTLYLALVTGGLAYTGQRQQRPLLGYAALAAGLLWGTFLLLTPMTETPDLVAIGLYLTALGAFVPLISGGGPGGHWPRVAAAGFASLQMAALVDLAGFRPLTWGLYLLLAGALAALGWRDARLRDSNAFVAALGITLLSSWQDPPSTIYGLVAAGMGAIILGVPLALILLSRNRQLDTWQLSLAAPALAAVNYYHFGHFDTHGMEPWLAFTTLVLSIPPALAAWRHRNLIVGEPSPFIIPLASAAALVFAALLMLVPGWAAPIAAAVVAGGLAFTAYRQGTAPVVDLTWSAAVIATLALVVTQDFSAEASRLAGWNNVLAPWQATFRWAAVALPFLALVRIDRRTTSRTVAEALLALFAYGAAAQVVPSDLLCWLAALGAIAACARFPRLLGVWAMLLAISAFWALHPLLQWLASGMLALLGDPMLLGDLPDIRQTLLHLLPLAVAAGFVAWQLRSNGKVATALGGIAALVVLVVAHVSYKNVFSVADLSGFARFGIADRTVWEGILIATGALLIWRGPAEQMRMVGIALAASSVAHFTWFTGILHNPLWAEQYVGSWRLLNWLLPSYAIAAIGLIALQRHYAHHRQVVPACDAGLMVLTAFFALSQLRQAFSGSLLMAAPMSQTEDLLRSLLGIVLAIAFLGWGSRSAKRAWRIGSLVLMLLAVCKVFLIDAAGLEGLTRIASFMALGFSLIGIGWFYSRQLTVRESTSAA